MTIGLPIIRCVAAGTFAFSLAVAPAAASEDQSPGQASQEQTRADFEFGRPAGSVGVRAGWLLPREEGDLFAFVRDNLTIEKGDFRSYPVGIEVGRTLTSRVTALFAYEFSRAGVDSESRGYIGSDGLPILQRTSLQTHHLTASLKLALTPAGRQISQYAWLRSAVVPYVGGGAGVMRYQLAQDGEFVDFQTLNIFEAEFRSENWTPGGHAFGGVDLQLWKNSYLTVEGRYVWADADLKLQFSGFEGIDLTGFRMLTGVNFGF